MTGKVRSAASASRPEATILRVILGHWVSTQGWRTFLLSRRECGGARPQIIPRPLVLYGRVSSVQGCVHREPLMLEWCV